MERNDSGSLQLYLDPMPRKLFTTHQAGPDWYLKEWMASLGVSQAELGRRTGWGKARASDICNGKTDYYREVLNSAAKALNLAVWELLMPPAEAHRIKRWRIAFEEEQHLRVAEERYSYKSEANDPDPIRRNNNQS